MSNKQENDNQAQNPEPATDTGSPIFFKANREGDWQADAAYLMQSVFYKFDQDNPESLVKVFATLANMKGEHHIKDALHLLMLACFNRSSVHSDFLNGYIETCRTHPTAWDKAEANPQRVTATDTAAQEEGRDELIDRLIECYNEARRNQNFVRAEQIKNTLAGRGIILEDSPQGATRKPEAEPVSKGHWIGRLCEALAEAFQDQSLDEDTFNNLSETVLNITQEHASDVVTETRVLLPVALARASGRERNAPPPQSERVAEYCKQRETQSDDTHSHIENFVASLTGLLKNVSLPKDVSDQLTDAADAIINREGIKTESHIEAHLPYALMRIAARERDKENEDEASGEGRPGKSDTYIIRLQDIKEGDLPEADFGYVTALSKVVTDLRTPEEISVKLTDIMNEIIRPLEESEE
jgi:hypothetical protein